MSTNVRRCPECGDHMENRGKTDDGAATIWHCPICLIDWHRQKQPRRNLFREPDRT